MESDRPIIAPHSLPMFKEDFGAASAGGRGGKRRREKDRMDPVKTLRPLPPVEGRGRGGRVGASAMQHVVQGMLNSNGQDDVSFISSFFRPLELSLILDAPLSASRSAAEVRRWSGKRIHEDVGEECAEADLRYATRRRGRGHCPSCECRCASEAGGESLIHVFFLHFISTKIENSV